MRLLIVASDRMEFSGILARATRMEAVALPIDWARRGWLGGHEVLLAANGVGRVRAAAAVDAALPAFPADRIISAGYCGALDPELRPGDIVVADCVSEGEQRYVATPITGPKPFRVGGIRTVDHVVQTSEEKRALHALGASGVDMEAAAVAERACVNRVAFSCVRGVTDLAKENLLNDFTAALRPDGHFDTMVILGSCLRHPFVRLPELIRLRKRCIRASCARETSLLIADAELSPIPSTMQAAVYRGKSVVAVEEVPTPEIGSGEILIRVEACGICNTDLKKIAYNLLAPPRIFGHETAGVVVAVGSGVTRFRPGDRVVAFHHIPCLDCFYCRRKLYAQCPRYKQVGITAGFEPAGGGFSQYVRVMDWIVERGVEKIPDGVSFERAALVEPLNTCMKAMEQIPLGPEDLVMVMGQGPMGLMLTMLAHRTGAQVAVTDAIEPRLALARRCGAQFVWNVRETNVSAEAKRLTQGRGADVVIVAATAPGIIEQAMASSRPGAKILLFAQTSAAERVETNGADLVVGERTLFGSYSASVDLQNSSASLIFGGELPVDELISHRLPLVKIDSGIELALHPGPNSLKIIIQPQRWS